MAIKKTLETKKTLFLCPPFSSLWKESAKGNSVKKWCFRHMKYYCLASYIYLQFASVNVSIPFCHAIIAKTRTVSAKVSHQHKCTLFEKSNFCPKIQFWQNPNIFTSFSPKNSTIFSGNQSWIFGQKMKISNSVLILTYPLFRVLARGRLEAEFGLFPASLLLLSEYFSAT